MSWKRFFFWTGLTLFLLGAARLAPLNQDEGWYLLASRRVTQGQIPYRDFTFTQGPVFPLVYALAEPLVRMWGLYGGRIVQVLLSLLTLGVLKASAPVKAFPLLLALFCLPVHLQFSLTVKTYALAGLFLTLAVHFWFQQTRKSLIMSALFLSLATATRLSLGVFLLPLCVSLSGRRNELSAKTVALFLLCYAGISAVLLLPFLLIDPASVWFQWVGFHQARSLGLAPMFRVGSLLRLLHAWLPTLLVGGWFLQRKALSCPDRAVAFGLALTGGLHLMTPFPYEEYQTPLYTVLLMLLFRNLNREAVLSRHRGLVLAAVLFSLSSPALHNWMPVQRDRLWFSVREQSDLGQLEWVARRIRKFTPENAVLFTPDSYLAIATGFEVPRGLEMGPFSFDPSGNTPELLDLNGILEAISQSDIVAFTPYLFVRAPQVQPMSEEEERILRDHIQTNFEHFDTIPRFGQTQQDLEIWFLRRP